MSFGANYRPGTRRGDSAVPHVTHQTYLRGSWDKPVSQGDFLSTPEQDIIHPPPHYTCFSAAPQDRKLALALISPAVPLNTSVWPSMENHTLPFKRPDWSQTEWGGVDGDHRQTGTAKLVVTQHLKYIKDQSTRTDYNGSHSRTRLYG